MAGVRGVQRVRGERGNVNVYTLFKQCVPHTSTTERKMQVRGAQFYNETNGNNRRNG